MSTVNQTTTAGQEVLLAWAYELRRLCRECGLDAMSATKGGSTLHVTRDRVRVTDPERGLVEVVLEDVEPAGLFDGEGVS